METTDYLRLIAEELHTSVMATVDKDGHPVTCAIDIMDWDETGLFFLTAKGKSLYDRLTADGHLAITLMKGNGTMNTLAVSLKGCVREIGPAQLPQLFDKNPYMYEIYPVEESRRALTVFHIYEGTGEWFNMGNGNIEHAEFALGSAAIENECYYVADNCSGCGTCIDICPRNVISINHSSHAVIDQVHCIRCGNCMEICPVKAISKMQ